MFVYNGDGQRVQKQDSTGTTKHVWDGQNILLETNASNIIQVVYTLEPLVYGNLISQSRSGVDSFYLFDAMGSTRQLANSGGSVTDSYLYDSFGNTRLSSGTTINVFRYCGRIGCYYDFDISQFYMRHRYQNPSIGRFVSRDTSGFSDGLNLYLYVKNNSVNHLDPNGLKIATIACCSYNRTCCTLFSSFLQIVPAQTTICDEGVGTTKCCNDNIPTTYSWYCSKYYSGQASAGPCLTGSLNQGACFDAFVKWVQEVGGRAEVALTDCIDMCDACYGESLGIYGSAGQKYDLAGCKSVFCKEFSNPV